MPQSYEPDPDHPLTTALPYFPPDEQAWLQEELGDILNTRLSMGKRVAQFQQEFAAYCGASYGVAFPNCTAALESALAALEVQPGDEVLVPAETFVATGMVVHMTGATPVFTEVSDQTFCMDFDDAWSRVTERTKGAIVVHFAGIIAPEFSAFVEKMRRSGRFVIEDAAHAPGAEIEGQRAGSMSDAACFSFYSTKVMTTGEGGMLVTSRDDIARTAEALQNRGLDLDAEEELYSLPGRNNRFTEIAAAMGLSQLRSLPGFLEARRSVARTYDRLLAETEVFRPVLPAPGVVSSYWRYVAVSPVVLDRPVLKNKLLEHGITIDWPYDPPVHLQPVFRRLMGTKPGMLPKSEDLLARHICLPMHSRMRTEDAEYVVETLSSLAKGSA